ncbi:hypothetical protein [Nostoc sp.]|uniref:hypothetical protein n=1 Tax=Nostoc sp. TaxID=1180 RepID=UPI002FF5FC73
MAGIMPILQKQLASCGVGISPTLSSLYLCPSTYPELRLFTNQDKLSEELYIAIRYAGRLRHY